MDNQLITSIRDQFSIIPANHVKEFSKKLTTTSVASRVEEILKHHSALIIKLIAYARHKDSVSFNSTERSHINYVLLADAIMEGIKTYSSKEVVENLDIGIKLVEKLIDDHSYEVLKLMELMFLETTDINVSLLYNRFYKTMIQAFHPKTIKPSDFGLVIQNQDALDKIRQLSATPGVQISYEDLESILTCYNTVQENSNWWKTSYTMTKPSSKHDNITALSCRAREDIAISRKNIENFDQIVEFFNIVNNQFIMTHETLREGSKNTQLTAEQIDQQKKQLEKISKIIEEDGVNEDNKDDLLDLIDACKDYNSKANNFLEKTTSKTDSRMKELLEVKEGVHDSIANKRPLALQGLQPNKKALITDTSMFSDNKENSVFNRLNGLSA